MTQLREPSSESPPHVTCSQNADPHVGMLLKSRLARLIYFCEVRTFRCTTHLMDTGTSPAPKHLPPKRRKAACPAEAALQVIGGRWKTLILWHLFQGVNGFPVCCVRSTG